MISVILLLLFSLTQGQITDLSIQGYTITPTFDPAVLSYTAEVPTSVDEVIFNAQNVNDRFWLQIFRETCCDRTDFTAFWEMPVYDDSPPFPISDGDNIFFFTQENSPNTVYEILIDRTETSTTTTSTTMTETTTTTTTTTTSGPTETQITTDTPVVALPEQSPNVPACDSGFIDETWVNLIAQEGDETNNCASLTVRADNGEELPIEDTCPCFLASDKDYLLGINCRPNEATMYVFSDMANWCYGEEAILEGPTDTVLAFNKTEDDFDISTWSGVDDEYIYPGQKMRQTYIANDMDAEAGGDSNYMLVEFDACLYGDWEEGDAITVEIDFTEVFRQPMPAGNYGDNCDDGPSKHFAIVPLDPYFDTDDSGDFHEFTLGFTSNLAGARDDEYFSVTPVKLETFTRQDVSTFCLERYSYNASMNYPIFVQETSGFIWNYAASPIESIRLHLEVEVPRQLFDFTIDFDNGDGVAGYNAARAFAGMVNDATTETFWTSDLLTDASIVSSTQDNCGFEKWVADIPWTVFNEAGAGGVNQFESYSNGTAIDDAEDWYLFGSTSVFTGYESVYTEQAGREWETERYSTWRVPFIVRFQRTVFVETIVNVILCPDNTNVRDPYCTITHVAAIVEQVQADTVYDLETRDYRAEVNLKINTEVFYPYMLINGVTPVPNTTQRLFSGQYFPPSVEYTPAAYIPQNTQAETEFTWLRETTDDCTYQAHNEISLNLGRICPQFWNMYIKPLNGACYIDGDYVVTWSARCFYDKPVCTFNSDDNGDTLNTVAATFTVHSTNMCPEIVHETDIYGEICPTGRYDYALCADAQSAAPGEDIFTYFQDDFVHFFINTGSNDAKIIFTEILEVWVEQDFSDPQWPVDSSVTPTDMNYDGLVKLWDSSAADNSHEWTNSITGVTETVIPVVEQTMDSNDFVDKFPTVGMGRGDTDYGLYSGYKVRVDSKIFPRTSDRWLDATFQVKMLVWYEGWGNDKPDRRMLQEQSDDYSMGGKQSMWLRQRIKIQREIPRFVPCYADQEKHVWTLKMRVTDEQWTSMHGSFDHYMRREMRNLFQTNDIEWVGYTQDQENQNDVVAVWRADSNKWDELVSFFTNQNFPNAPLLFDLKVSDVYCMDASDEVGLIPLTECATGKPCVFLPDQVLLEEYFGQKTETDREITFETDSSACVFSLTMAFIWALFF